MAGSYWPNGGDYLEAVQNPSLAFKDPRLKVSKPQTNKMGLPRTRAGALANVYKFESPAGSNAVRVFLYENAERAQRYQTVSDHLNRKRPSSMVEFGYHAQGICVRNQWFPILIMQWVDGMILGNWVEKVVMAGDAKALRTMSDRWIDLIRELYKFEIAHGDLQHANVMVLNDGRPVLVDYDCMGVPGLFDQRPPERGLPAYQHPHRINPRRFDPQGESPPLSPHLDAFSAMVILTALRALANDLNLWKTFVTKTGNENLLFTDKDHANPGQSPLYASLARSSDPQVAEWAARLREWADGAFDKHKSIEEFLEDPFDSVRKAIAAKDWDKVAAAGPVKGKPLPPELATVKAKAAERLKARDRLRDALSAGDHRRIAQVRAGESALLDDWPAVKGVLDQAAPSAAIVQTLDALKKVAGTPAIVDAWKRAGGKPVKGAEGAAYEAEVNLRVAVTGKSWDAIVPLVYPQGKTAIPKDLAAVAALAQDKGAKRELLDAAVRSKDARRIASALATVGTTLDDWPACAAMLAEGRRVSAVIRDLDEIKKVAGTPAILDAWKRVGAKLPPGPETNRYRSEVDLRQAVASKSWDAIVPLVYPQGKIAVPSDLQQVVALAQQKAALRAQMEDAVRSGEARRIDGTLSAAGTLLDDWPACAPLLAEARRGAQLVAVLDRLERARGSPELATLWDRHAHELAGVPDAEVYRREAADWTHRIAALGRLRQAVAGGSSERSIAEAWAALEAIGSHPDAAVHRGRALEASRRVECLEQVNRLLALPASEDADRQVVAAWNKPLMDPCAEARPARVGVDAARQRLDVLQKIAAHAARPAEGAEKERLIVEAAAPLPPGYAFPLASRVETARLRHPAYQELAAAIAANSDVRIAQAWDGTQTVGAAVTDPAVKARCRTAYLRREALDKISTSIPRALPEHEQDSLWISLWTKEVDDLLRPSADAAKVLTRYQKARSRRDDLAALKAALDVPDPSRVQELSDRLKGYPPVDDLRARIDLVLADFLKVRAITTALDQYIQPGAGEREKAVADQKVRASLNLELLGRYPGEFLRHRGALERWFKERVLHRPPTPADPLVVWDPGNPRRVRVRWLWSDDAIGVHRVATDTSAPPSRPGGAKVKRGELNQNGGWPVSLDGPRVFVAIWPVVELAWVELVGPPLIVGPISPAGPGGNGSPPGVTQQPPRRAAGNPWSRSPSGPSGLARP